ncbi:LYR family of Fe/S cluster biogenesis protein [Wolffia australiana]
MFASPFFSMAASILSKAQRWRGRSTAALFRRGFLNEGPDSVDELLDRHLVKKEKSSEDDGHGEIAAVRRLTSTRREALALYRDILRATRFFPWPDSRGVPWREVLRENARREFEQARFERDPEIITRLLIGGRDAVQSALDKLVEKHRKMAGDGGKGENFRP